MANPLAYLFQGIAQGAQPMVQQYPLLMLRKMQMDQEQAQHAAAQKLREDELGLRREEFGANKEHMKLVDEYFKKEKDITIPDLAKETARKETAFEQQTEANRLALDKAYAEFGEFTKNAPLRARLAGNQADQSDLMTVKLGNEVAAGGKQLERMDDEYNADRLAKQADLALKQAQTQQIQGGVAMGEQNLINARLEALNKIGEMTGVDFGAGRHELNKTLLQISHGLANSVPAMYGSGMDQAKVEAATQSMTNILEKALITYAKNEGISDESLTANTPEAQRLRGFVLRVADRIHNGDPDAFKALDAFGTAGLKQAIIDAGTAKRGAAESQPTSQPTKEPTGIGNYFKDLLGKGKADPNALASDEVATASRLGLNTKLPLRELAQYRSFKDDQRRAGVAYSTQGDTTVRLSHSPALDEAGIDPSRTKVVADWMAEHDQYTKDSILDLARYLRVPFNQSVADQWLLRTMTNLEGKPINESTIREAILKPKPTQPQLSTVEKIFGG